MAQINKNVIEQLKKDILLKQGYKPASADTLKISGLQQVEANFPNGVFPTGMIHEFISNRDEHASACRGFISGLLNSLTGNKGMCIWVSMQRTIYAPALKEFGIEPDQLIFVDVAKEKDLLWVTEEALKCDGFAAVITEIKELSFSQSLRLQLAVEQSKVTGLVLRTDDTKINPTATVARWQITPLPSHLQGGLPGVGFPRWKVELLKVRNGQPGAWEFEWQGGKFLPVYETESGNINTSVRKAG
ncbi:Error-prone repair protein ImuA [uncultured Mucilaginibacter sp.]|uniref:ImuA family protein n=1 Tax=uncultured Mucilaginibacter sp. TaxID=797541 RepID=UPI0025F6FCB8|nr:Error-prone repair protein ImuA [uncultured Mucilaginibacter sp.]